VTRLSHRHLAISEDLDSNVFADLGSNARVTECCKTQSNFWIEIKEKSGADEKLLSVNCKLF
jgi:hypothetical protein